jgi:hypothetical protein
MSADTRKKMLEKVKAILAKTMENGCTEGEAMAALAKAKELMATYEIDEAELKEFDREKATIHKTAVSDPYEIKRGLCVNVGRFTNCKAFRDHEEVINFAGKEGDIIFATWLLDTLQRYVMRALRDYQKKRTLDKMPNSNFTSASFVIGCTFRINEKLKELVPIDWAKTQELIVKELNMSLTKSRGRGKDFDKHAASSGQKAGDHARFDRPVGSGEQLRLK